MMRKLLWLAPLLLTGCALHFPGGEVHRERREVTREASVPELRDEPDTVPVVIFADTLHTGLILELPWLERHGYVPPAGLTRRRYVAFSWGDETAYVQERWLHPGQVFHALFLPSSSVKEVISFDHHVPEVLPGQRLYQSFVRDSAGRPLAEFLNRGAIRGADGRPQVVAPSTWGDGVMVRSPYSYYFPRICNIWTIDALNAAGLEFGGLAGLSADGVVRQALEQRNGFRKIWDPAWRMPDGPAAALS